MTCTSERHVQHPRRLLVWLLISPVPVIGRMAENHDVRFAPLGLMEIHQLDAPGVPRVQLDEALVPKSGNCYGEPFDDLLGSPGAQTGNER